MKIITKLLLTLTVVSNLAWAQKSPSSFASLESQLKTHLKTAELHGFVKDLVKVSFPSRFIGKPGHDKALEWLQTTIRSFPGSTSGAMTVMRFTPAKEVGIALYENDFQNKIEGKIPSTHPDYQKWKMFTGFMVGKLKGELPEGQTLVWEKKGISDEWLVITAHYDTVSHHPKTLFIDERSNMPGANYNGSGVAVALGLIKWLSTVNLNTSVRVVFLDYQALGFLGSYHYAQEIKNQKIRGVINLEMLGQDTSFLDKTKQTGNLCAYIRSTDSAEERWANELLKSGNKIGSKTRFELRANDFENSDNVRFQAAGIKTVTFSQNWEDDFNPKFYQTTADTPETLNMETLYGAYLYLGGVLGGQLLDLVQ